MTALEWFYDKIKDKIKGDEDLIEDIIFTFCIAKQKEQSNEAYLLLGVVFIVTEANYYDESGNYEILKAFKTIEGAENYINELKSSYKGLATKIWEWEEVELF